MTLGEYGIPVRTAGDREGVVSVACIVDVIARCLQRDMPIITC